MSFKNLILYLILSFCITCYAQQDFKPEYSIDIGIGIREIYCDSFANTKKLDFMNYISTDQDYIDELYISIDAEIKFKPNWNTRLKLQLLSNLVPNNFQFELTKLYTKSLGIQLGMIGYPLWNNEFNQFHLIEEPNMNQPNTNFRQFIMYDFGVFLAPQYIFSLQRLSIKSKVGVGASNFSRFSTSLLQKEINSNFKEIILYQSTTSLCLFIFPEFQIKYNVIESEKLNVGLTGNVNYFYSKRKINYQIDNYQWTYANKVTNIVNSPLHKFTRLDANIGICLSW